MSTRAKDNLFSTEQLIRSYIFKGQQLPFEQTVRLGKNQTIVNHTRYLLCLQSRQGSFAGGTGCKRESR